MRTWLTAERMTTCIISFACFMESVDSTVINTAIPAMSRSLHVDPVDLKVALVSYLLSLAIFIPISGWLADKFGAKKVFINALLIFSLSSLWCGFAHSLTSLIVARFIQGLGGAMQIPIGRLIILRMFGRKRFITQMSQVIMVGALGVMLGPVIGGLLTTYYSWHWIFWVNLPMGGLAMMLACRWLENTAPCTVPPLDVLGFILFGLGLSGFTLGLSALSQTTASSGWSLSVIGMSVVLLVVYVVYARQQAHPIIRFCLFKHNTFSIAAMGNLLARLGIGGVPFLVPLLLQVVFGYSAKWSGLLIAPMAIGVVLAKFIILKLLRRFGYKRLLMLNAIFGCVSIWTFALVSAYTPMYVVSVLTLLYGFMVSLQYSVLNSLTYSDVGDGHLSAATSMAGTLQQLAQSFGVALSALLIRFFSSMLHTHVELTLSVFHETFFVLGFFSLFSLPLFMRLSSNDGHQMIS